MAAAIGDQPARAGACDAQLERRTGQLAGGLIDVERANAVSAVVGGVQELAARLYGEAADAARIHKRWADGRERAVETDNVCDDLAGPVADVHEPVVRTDCHDVRL